MQLIMSTDIDIGIKSMSSINQESHLVTDFISELTNEHKENIEKKEHVTDECAEKESEIKCIISETIDDESFSMDTNEQSSDKTPADETTLTTKDEEYNVKETDDVNSKADEEKSILKSSDFSVTKDDQTCSDTDKKQEDFLINNVDTSDFSTAEDDQTYSETDKKQEDIHFNNVEEKETPNTDEESTDISKQIEEEMEICEDIICCPNVDNNTTEKDESFDTSGKIMKESNLLSCENKDDDENRDDNNTTEKDESFDTNDEIMKESSLLSCENKDDDENRDDLESKVKNNDLISFKNIDNKETKIIGAVDNHILSDDLTQDAQNNVEENTEDNIESNNEDLLVCDKDPEQPPLIDSQIIKENTASQPENTSLDPVLDDDITQVSKLASDQNIEGYTKANIQNTEVDTILADDASKQTHDDNRQNENDNVENIDNEDSKKEDKILEVEDLETSNDNSCDVSENQENEAIDVVDDKIDNNQKTQLTEEKIKTAGDKSPQEETREISDVDNNNTFNNEKTEANEFVSSLNKRESTENEINSIETKEQSISKDSDVKVMDKMVNHDDNGIKRAVSNTKVIERKKLTHISRLSNTLDILSDEEDEPLKLKSPIEKEVPPSEKQCYNIEDDDDIMVIDDEISKDTNNASYDEPKDENIESAKANEDSVKKELMNEPAVELTENMECSMAETDPLSAVQSESKEEKIQDKKPLLPPTFLKTCKKNLADMTREELEEFCIIKIVESVVDRSNLGELKSQIRTMTSNIEEYKKKATMLLKQNRDLQVVLKSVQEEQKKNTGAPVTPLKITRSVGMQVLMTEKGSRKRSALPTVISPLNNSNTNFANNRQTKPQNNQTRKSMPLQIPVPRLVPASNANNAKNMTSPTQTNVNNSTKPQRTNSLPNGIKITSPNAKPEKRTYEKMQQNSSVTVDLTDDEPPTKLLTRNINPPVRCVPPQNLMAPKQPLSQPLSQPLNSPRKVYIPIGGPPKQTIMLKSIPTQSPAGPRPRAFPPKMIQNQNIMRTALPRAAFKHPAPLPDSMKQYQPSNWKLLPPAPDLKLSKVENGIVISWKIDGYVEEKHEEIASYQLFAYQETSSPPSTSLWKKIGDVKALPLPMACTLTQFMAGYKYYFAVRAVDIKSRFGPFSLPGSILLLNKV